MAAGSGELSPAGPAAGGSGSGYDLNHAELVLITDLSRLNRDIARFVLRALDADAGRVDPATAEDEYRLGVRLAELGAVLRERAGIAGAGTTVVIASRLPSARRF